GFQLKSIREREIPFLRRKLGVVFQDFRLLTDRTIYKNLHFVLKATGWTDEVKMKQRIDRILDEAGMSGAANKMPHQLSGGEQQRIVIARALLNDPDILLADEPTGNLDPETSVEIMEMFRKIHAEGKTLLVATHDKLVVDRFPGRTLLCREGTIIEKTEEGEWIDFRSYEVE
nr:ATP-binding cassette domain-containing protein [Prolixibacteraceae bacterium]